MPIFICKYIRKGETRAGIADFRFSLFDLSQKRNRTLSQNYYLTVFSCLFSKFFVKRDTIQSNIQFQY